MVDMNQTREIRMLRGAVVTLIQMLDGMYILDDQLKDFLKEWKTDGSPADKK